MLSQIAKIEPQAAYTCFISGYKHKLTYYMRTIPNIGQLLMQIDNVIMTEFIPAISGGINISETERKLLSFPPKYGGLGIPIFSEISDIEYENSIKIVQQFRQHAPDINIKKKKNTTKTNKVKRNKAILDDIRSNMNE